MNDESGPADRPLAIGYVPGVQPDKWLDRWRQRRPDVPVTAHRAGDPRARLAADRSEDGFDVIFLREPEDAPRAAPPGLLRIPLYTETMAVLAPKDHELAVYASLTMADLEGERWVDPVDAVTASPDEVGAAVDLVAAGVGLLVLPLPYARSLSRRDVIERPLDGVPATRMGVAWSPAREGDELIEEFVGIVRGRTAATSRGAAQEPRPKLTAKEKTAAKARSRGQQPRGQQPRGQQPQEKRPGARGAGRRRGR